MCRGTLLLSIVLAAATSARASILYDESVSGDLPNSQTAPTARTMAAGTNSIKGVVGLSDSRDWIAVTVPVGNVLSSLVLFSYVSSDSQGFIGVQAGPNFIGDPTTAPPYLGYAHFGTAATNGTLPPTNLVGANLLPLMGNTSIAFGAVGFTPPLGAGTYTFIIQQLGASTTYQFDLNASPPPPGDFNSDGRVNAADYVVWRKTNTPSNGYNTWRSNFGATLASGALVSNTAVPEPTSAILFFLAAAISLCHSRLTSD